MICFVRHKLSLIVYKNARDTILKVESYITIQDLYFQQGRRPIFSNITLSIPKGKLTAVLGPSGTGKTTLLKLITAQWKPDSGIILIDNKNVHALSHEALLLMRRDMGLLFQNGALFTGMNVFENVAFPLRVHTNLSELEIRTLVLLKLNAVGLRGARALMPSELSGGMARRVALARAIILDPRLLLYDEPLAGQDPISKGILMKLMRTLNDALGSTSIVVSHDVPEMFKIADYLYIISEGKIIGQGTPQELERTTIPEIKQFVYGEPDGPVPFHYPVKDYKEDLLGPMREA